MLSHKHPIENRFVISNREVIQLFSMNTPNGKKVSIALDELKLPYEPHLVHIGKNEQHTEEFLTISPNGKIPAILDPDGPDGAPLGLMESGAILLYLAQKTGKLMPRGRAAQVKCLQWLFFQVGHIGPMFGQFGHFHKFAKETCPHPYPVERYRKETMRLLGVLEARLKERDFIMGEYTIADIATFPWLNAIVGFYDAAELVEFDSFKHVAAWYSRCMERPASISGSQVCAP